MLPRIVYFSFGVAILLWVYLRHNRKTSLAYANWWHRLSIHHPIISQLLSGRGTPDSMERELRQKNNSKFVSFLLIIIVILFFAVAFL